MAYNEAVNGTGNEMEIEETVVHARHYRSGEPLRLTLQGGRIAAIEPLVAAAAETASLPLVAPGFVDLQINGFAGIDINADGGVTPDDVARLTRLLWREGVTSYLPTIITNSPQAITEALRAIVRACRDDAMIDATIAGIHLEGPYISPQDGARGAHNAAYVAAPDWEQFQRWQEAAEGRIRLLTLSPEWDGARAFIAKCTASGVVVSIGHTSATPEQIREAVRAGASMSTHLGNGSHAMQPRHANYIYEQLACDELQAMVIADGFHLPVSLLKVFQRAKQHRFMLVSDAVHLAGMPPGEYETHIGGRVVLTPEGRLHLAEHPQVLAGSAQMLLAGVTTLVRAGLNEPADAWDLASLRPAAAFKLPAAAGLAAGAPADLVLLEWPDGEPPTIASVYKSGVAVSP
ncbi:N-acetylglucosamine-6-phosphate deacetylase [Paenibacillus cymbidii]|uniref:N-acetylglucosamine-6-phosphate deacetylase n=1 Tax=Paenibacillus cymbidii TaxID=1639034 RepID=UPI001F2F3220|nr:amidohydrolase family protein [Paenibacillus cymbidii]